MSDKLKGITRRITRIFTKQKVEQNDAPRKKIETRRVLRPESIKEESFERRPPRGTVRLQDESDRIEVTELLGGVIHVRFKQLKEINTREITIRDPVTNKKTTRKVTRGIKRTTRYYDDSGTLFDETSTDW